MCKSTLGHTCRGILKRPKEWPFEWKCTRGLLNHHGDLSRNNRVDRRAINIRGMSTLFRLKHRLRGPAKLWLSRVRDNRKARAREKGNRGISRRPSESLEGVGLAVEITHSAGALSGMRYAKSVASR